MEVFRYVTPAVYLLLACLWGYVLYFVLRRLVLQRVHGRLTMILLGVLALSAFSTLFESVFFGLRFSGEYRVLPVAFTDFLGQPHITLFPKLINATNAIITIFVLLRFWLPTAERERARLDAELVEFRQEYADLVNSINAIVWEANARTLQFSYVSPQAEQMTGWPLASWIEPGFWLAHIHPEDKAQVLEVLRGETKDTHHIEFRFRTKSGDYIWLQDTSSLLLRGGKNRVYRGLLVDVTAQHQDRVEREESHRRLIAQSQALVRVASDVSVIDGDLRSAFQTLTQAAAETLQVRRVSLWMIEDGQLVLNVLYDLDQCKFSAGGSMPLEEHPSYSLLRTERSIAVSDVYADARLDAFAHNYARQRGIVAILDVPVRIRGKVVALLCHGHVGSQRTWRADEVRFAEALADQAAHILLCAERRSGDLEMRRVATAIEQAAEAVAILTPDGVVEYLNPAFEKVTGYAPEELLHRALPPGKEGAADLLAQIFKAVKEQKRLQSRITHEELGETSHILNLVVSPIQDQHGKIISFAASIQDVTYQSTLENSLRQAVHMESIGRLAGGISHDFNNILQIIMGNLDLASDEPGIPDASRKLMREAQRATDRAVDLTRQLLTFSRRQSLQTRNVDINTLLGELLLMIKTIIGKKTVLALEPSPEAGNVMVDPGQLEQVILNLCLNARDAMPDGGNITISTSMAVLNVEDLKPSPWVEPGRFAVISVADNGNGMDQETVTRVFEPFFTTKEVGKGTGLGLSMVYGIIKQHGGFINVRSNRGIGSTFTLYLPAAASEAPAPQRTPTPLPIVLPRTDQLILLADDNEAARSVTAAMLSSAGYRVVEAANGEEAVRQYIEYGHEIALIVMDIIMPVMNGREAYERICTIRNTPVVFITGYSGDALEQRLISTEGVNVLRKPFHREALLAQVFKALSQANQTSAARVST